MKEALQEILLVLQVESMWTWLIVDEEASLMVSTAVQLTLDEEGLEPVLGVSPWMLVAAPQISESAL